MSGIFIITGPSGVGKTTVAKALLRQHKNLARVVTYTTRPPRPGEVKERDYHFVTRPVFQKMLARREFFEHAAVYGDWYGSAWSELKKIQASGRTVLLVVDVQGAKFLRKKLRGSRVIFLVPENMVTLAKRLRGARRQETPARLARRLAAATAELAQRQCADFVVINRQGQRGATERAVADIILAGS